MHYDTNVFYKETYIVNSFLGFPGLLKQLN
jgi:hypothetical protein